MSRSIKPLSLLGDAPVEVVESFQDLEEKEVLAEAGRTDGKSKWQAKKREIEGRKSKWLERFAAALTEDDIAPDVLTFQEARIERMRQTGWEPSQVRPEKVPPTPVPTRMDQIPKYKALAAVTYLCYKCWRSVPVGVDRVSCKLCNVVAHRKCIPDLAKYAVNSSQPASAKPASAGPAAEVASAPGSRQTPSLQEPMKTHPDVLLYKRVRTAVSQSAQFTNTLYGTEMGDLLQPKETGAEEQEQEQRDYKSQQLADIALNNEDFPPPGTADRKADGSTDGDWAKLAKFAEGIEVEQTDEDKGYEEFDEAAEELDEVNALILEEIKEAERLKAARRSSPPGSAGRTLVTLADMKKSMRCSSINAIMSPLQMKRMNSLRRMSTGGSEGNGSPPSVKSASMSGAATAEAQSALEAIAAVQQGFKPAPRLAKTRHRANRGRHSLIDLDVCKVVWKCPFCVEEVVSYNKHYLNNFEKTKHNDLVLKSVLQLQSFSRMVPTRVHFLTSKFGIIHAQRKFRARLFWLKMAADTMNVPRPFRLKIHDIMLVYRNSDATLDIHPRDLASDSTQIGQMMASVYPAYSTYESQGKDVPRNHKELLKLLMGDNFAEGTGVSNEVALYSQTFNKAANVARNDLFLTVCIAESRPDGDVRQAKQYYRFDIPLRQSNKAFKLTPARLEMLGCSNMDEMSRHDLEMIQENYKIVPCSLARPYILLPSCSRNSTVKITLSEVGEWPKSTCLGQASEMINNYLMWKKIVSMRQGMVKCTWADLPVPDELSKLDVRLPAKHKQIHFPGIKGRGGGARQGKDRERGADGTAADGDEEVTAPLDTAERNEPGAEEGELSRRRRTTNPRDLIGRRADSPTASSAGAKLPLIKTPQGKSASGKGGGGKASGHNHAANGADGPKEFVKEFVASQLTWSLLSVSYDGCDFAGYMMFLVMASVHSAKKKCWCIMIDGILMTFSSITDLKTKESIDLRYCHIAELAEGVIELIYVKEQPQKIWYYVLPPTPKERSAWLSKFHEISMYGNKQPTTA